MRARMYAYGGGGVAVAVAAVGTGRYARALTDRARASLSKLGFTRTDCSLRPGLVNYRPRLVTTVTTANHTVKLGYFDGEGWKIVSAKDSAGNTVALRTSITKTTLTSREMLDAGLTGITTTNPL